jgi:hypothetical protein
MYDPAVQGMLDRAQKNVIRDFDNYLPEDVETLRFAGVFEEETLENVAAACADLSSLYSRAIGTGIAKPSEAEAMGLSAVINTGLEGARGFQRMADRLVTEMADGDQSGPLIDYLRIKQQTPGDALTHWTAMANHVLSLTDTALNRMCTHVIADLPEDDRSPAVVEESDKQFESTPLDQNMTIELILAALHHPKAQARAVIVDTPVVGELIRTYRVWQDTVRIVSGEKNIPFTAKWFDKPFVAKISPEELEALQQAFSHAEEPYKQQVKRMLPSWSHVKDYGLKDFHKALLYLNRSEVETLSFENEQDCKDITMLWYVLHDRGEDDSDSLSSTFTTLIEQEAAVRHAHEALQSKRIETEKPPVPEPEFVSRTLGLIDKHWDIFADLTEQYWPGSKGREAMEAVLSRISRTLDAYQSAAYEYEHPEARLYKIAESLGSLVIPNPNDTGESIDSAHASTRNELQAIVNNEKVDPDVRKRATVLLNYVTAPKGFATGTHVGDLRSTSPIQPVGASYYSVIFNSIDAKEWAVLVSLRPNTPTILIDVQAASQYGSLAEFIETLSIEEQQVLGAKILEHDPGWDPELLTRAIFKATTDTARKHG